MPDFSICLQDDKFYAEGDLPADDMREAGWFVYADKRRARTSRVKAVKPFLSACDASAYEIVERGLSAAANSVKDSFAAEADIDIPAPPGLAYRDYQKAGIAFMYARRYSLNADVPRLGKTIQTYGLANMHRKTLRILVICPANAKVGWVREGEKWLVEPHTVAAAYGDDLPYTDVVVINFEILGRHIDKLMSRQWDIVAIDEVHKLGSPKSKRTKNSFTFKPILHHVTLSGTPAFTRPIQLWPLVNAIDRTGLGKNWMTFTRRYCKGHKDIWGRYDVSGYSNLEELQLKLRQSVMVRREKSDVMDELPPMRKMVYLPATGLKKLIKEERSGFDNNLDELLDKVRQGLEDPDEALAYFDHLDITSRTSAAKIELGVRKVPMVKNYVDELVETEGKTIIFYHHREPLDAFYKSYDQSEIARIWGGMTAAQREAERVRFQEDESCTKIVCNLQSGSEAIELSAADNVVIAEFARAVPGEYDQAEERPWLPTKEMPIGIHNLVIEGSAEQILAEVLEYRRGQLDRLTCRANLN